MVGSLIGENKPVSLWRGMARTIMGIFLLALHVQYVAARDVPFTTGIALNADFNAAISVYPVDMDGDGDLDVLGTSDGTPPLHLDGKIVWWENVNGDGTAWTEHTVHNIFSWPSIHAADVDGDGDMDVIGAAPRSSDICWWENTNSHGTSWTMHMLDGHFDGANSVYTADVDGDGDLDVLGTAEDADDIAWWENTLDVGTAWTKHIVDGNFQDAECVYAADVDGDGDTDVLGGGKGIGEIAWWENKDDEGTSWTEHTVDGSFWYPSSVRAADVDRDGDMDILGASYMFNNITWWENTNSDGTTWSAHTVEGSFIGAWCVYVADVDLDGDVDILGAAQLGDDITWWENMDGTGTAWSEHTIDGNFDGASCAYAADMDGDGDLDVIGAAVLANDVTWWENKTIHRSATFPAEHTIDGNFDSALSVYAADVDGDGDLDVLGCSPDADDVTWWENTDGTGSAWAEHIVDSNFRDPGWVCAADVDGDGDMDVVAGGDDSSNAAWWENTNGNGLSWSKHTMPPAETIGFSVHTGDADGDGDTDVLVFAQILRVPESLLEMLWWENVNSDGTSWTKHVVHSKNEFDFMYNVDWCDIDKDRDIDLVAIDRHTSYIYWWENDGSGGGWTRSTIGWAQGMMSVYTGDVDGDADPDIIGGGGVPPLTEHITWYENQVGEGMLWLRHSIETDIPVNIVRAKDMDDDGDLDILGASRGGDKIAWYENLDGYGGAWNSHMVDADFDGPRSLYAADLDGDGDKDILGAGQFCGDITWWENRGGQFDLATTDTAPDWILEGVSDDMLKIVATHKGRAGDTDMELTTLELLFEESEGNPLSSDEANAIIENLHIYLDDGSGSFESGSDTLVTTVDILSLTSGVETVAFPDGDTKVQVAYGVPKTYFVVVELTANAASQIPNQFRVTHITESGSTAEDRDYDIPLIMEYEPNTASSVVMAVELGPTPTVAFDSAISSGDEGIGSTSLQVVLSAAYLSQVTVDYAVIGGTAEGGGEDYTLLPGTLIFIPGDNVEYINIIIEDNLEYENDETIIVALSNPTSATLGTITQHIYMIIDNDEPPTDWVSLLEGMIEEIRMPALYSGGSSYAQPAFGDLDNDGDPDVLLGEVDGTLTYWENVGTPMSAVWASPVQYYGGIDVGNNAAPCLGDVDGDKDMDLVVGLNNGTLTLYRNQREETRSKPVWGLPETNFAGVNVVINAVPTLGDMDNDHDLDLVVGNGDGTLIYKEKQGTSWGPQLGNYAGISVVSNGSPCLADMDGDGDLDLLVGQANGTLTYVDNIGSTEEAAWDVQEDNWQSISVGQWSAPAIADVNDDGRLDILIGNRKGEMGHYILGTMGVQTYSGNFEYIDIGDYSAPAFGDLDNDGDLDMLLGQSDGSLTFYRNAGNALIPHWHAAVEDFQSIDIGNNSAPALYDFNGDGMLDLVVGAQDGRIRYFVNTGTPSVPDFPPTPDDDNFANIDVGFFSTVCVFDADTDGDGDLLVGAYDGTLTYCENNGNRYTPTWDDPGPQTLPISADSYSNPAAVELNGDSLIDLVIGDDYGTLVAYFNEGTASFPIWITPEPLPGVRDMGDRSAPTGIDIDGDGDDDIVVGEELGGINVWRNNTLHLAISPRSVTLLEEATQDLVVSGVPPTHTLQWFIIQNGSGCSLIQDGGPEALYTAGTSGSLQVFDIIEVRDSDDPENLYARTYINVIRGEDVGSVGKAVICAGWDHGMDAAWPATNYLAQCAYKTLRIKGFSRDDIYYLSPVTGIDVDGDGDANNDIDAESTLANLGDALTTWASGTNDLTVYLVDHGWQDDGAGRFRINVGSENILTAAQLRSWLNALQSGSEMTQKVIIDSCFSGSFLAGLTPASGKTRFVATACNASQVTYFMGSGLISFSESFWNAIFCGATLGQAFVMARDAMDRYQAAWFDDNGDGVYEENVDTGPDSAAWVEYIGLSWIAGADRPQIGSVVSNQVLSTGTTSALLWADEVSGTYAIDRVWAVIVPPDFQPDPDSPDPVLDLPQLDLYYSTTNERWEATYESFTEFGSYKIIIYARDIWQSVSFPKQVYVHTVDLNEKAIVVVGSTPYATGVPLSSSYYLGNLAYRTLRNRGFSPDKIQYLSDEIGNSDVDDAPTQANLEDAVDTWAGSVDQLALYMVGEGSVDMLRLNDSETTSSTALDTLLDTYQTNTGTTVVVILECVESGSFLDDLIPPAGKKRVVETSCIPGTPSYCLAHGILSFSHIVLSMVFEGENLKTAFNTARNAVRFWTFDLQNPGLDDNADGESTGGDGELAWRTFIGAARLEGGGDLPRIGDHTPDSRISPDDVVTLWASDVRDSDGIDSVRAFIVPQPPLVLDEILELALTYNYVSQRWEVSHQFTSEGDYIVCFVARDREGTASLSYAALSLIEVTSVRDWFLY